MAFLFEPNPDDKDERNGLEYGPHPAEYCISYHLNVPLLPCLSCFPPDFSKFFILKGI